MNLHSGIMNIQIDEEELFYKYGNESLYAYKAGHRDARHAAAELSLKTEARIEELEEALKFIIDCSLSSRVEECYSTLYKCWSKAKHSLEDKQ